MLSEESTSCHVILVNYVDERVCILGHRGGEDHYLEALSHFMQELYAARPDQHVYIHNSPFQLDRQSYIRFLWILER